MKSNAFSLPSVTSLATLAVLTTGVCVRPGLAVPIAWTDWNAATVGAPGSAEGSLTADGLTVGVHYTGEVQSAQINGMGEYRYVQPIPGMEAYTSAAVDNAPATSDIIMLSGGMGTVNRFAFDNPLIDPVLIIVGMGLFSAAPFTWRFNAPFTVLSSGFGYWGMGEMGLTDIGGNVLAGQEAHGAIRFTGTYSSISFTAPQHDADWEGITLGAAGVALPAPPPDGGSLPAAPEPGGMALFVLGLALIGATGRRRFYAAFSRFTVAKSRA